MTTKRKVPENAFIGRTTPPEPPELAYALGQALLAWKRILEELDVKFGVRTREWTSHSPKWGWSLRVKRKARTIVWLAPADGAFNVLFILGERAVRAAQKAGLSRRLLRKVNNASKFPEGRVVRLAIRREADLGAVRRLAAIKLAN